MFDWRRDIEFGPIDEEENEDVELAAIIQHDIEVLRNRGYEVVDGIVFMSPPDPFDEEDDDGYGDDFDENDYDYDYGYPDDYDADDWDEEEVEDSPDYEPYEPVEKPDYSHYIF